MTRPAPIIVTWAKVVGFQGAGFVVAMITVALAAMVFPPHVYGLYGLLLSLVQIVAGVGTSWVNLAALRYGREEFTRDGTIRLTAGSTILLQGALLAFLGFLFVTTLPSLARHFLAEANIGPLLAFILAGLLTAQVAADSANYLAQATNRFTGYGLGHLIGRSGPAVAVLLVVMGVPINALVLLGGAGVGWMLAAIFTLRSIPPELKYPLGLDPLLIRQMLAYGWRLPLASIASVAMTWMDVWFIKAFVGIGAAGTYAWASSVFNLLTVGLIAFSAVLAPRLIDLHLRQNPKHIAEGGRTIAALFALAVALMPMALAAVRAGGILGLPSSYTSAAGPLALLVAASAFQFLTFMVGPLVVSNEKLIGAVALQSIVMLGVNTAGNAVLVPLLAGEGAALSKILAVAIGAVSYYRFMRQACEGAEELPPRLQTIILISIALFIIAVVVSLAPPRIAVFLSLLSSAIFLLILRQTGLFHDLLGVVPYVSPLPAPMRVPLEIILTSLAGRKKGAGV